MKLIKQNDPEALAAAILELKQSETKRNRLAKQAYEIYKTKLSPGILVEALLK